MPLVTTKLMLAKAQKRRYAVPHFNIINLETAKAVLEACEELNSPVILATSNSAIDYAGIKTLFSIVKTLASKAPIPVALHLDHSPTYGLARDSIREGWTSIMRDSSNLDFSDNVVETSRVVKLAHKKRIPVEAELGRLKGVEGWVKNKEELFTDPDYAKQFVKITKCDSLAISIGTSHGAYKFKHAPKLDFKRLREIRKKVQIPLVLHGASSVPYYLLKKAKRYGANLSHARGVPESQLRRAIKTGICKINIDTDLRIAFDAAMREFLKKQPKDFNPRGMLTATMQEMKKVVKKKIHLFGSVNKA